MRFFVITGAAVAALLGIASNASANESGLPGYSGKPTTAHPAGESCNQCHSGGSTPTVAFTGPATLTYGEIATYSLVVTTTEKEAAAGIAATDGVTLTAVTNVRASFGEMVPGGHTATSAGQATFTFKVTAPTTGSAIKLWGVGLADNGNGSDSGDKAVQVTMDIALPGTATDAGADSGSDAGPVTGEDSGASSSGGSSASSSSSSSGGVEDDAGASTSSSSSSGRVPSDEGGSGGCNVSGAGGSGSALFVAALGLVPLLARRRQGVSASRTPADRFRA